jgi:hypothetical protein
VQVQGSAKNGRVTQDDIKNHVRKLAAGGGGGGPIQAPPLPDFKQWGELRSKTDSKATLTHRQAGLKPLRFGQVSIDY